MTVTFYCSSLVLVSNLQTTMSKLPFRTLESQIFSIFFKLEAPPIRFWIAVMIFFTTFTNYMLRANMSVSIIKMVDRKARNFTPPCKEGQVEVVANEVKLEDIVSV